MRIYSKVTLVLFIVFLFSLPLYPIQADTKDTLYIDGFAIDKAFLQELKDVVDYDSTDFLTYELNYYNEILENEPRLEELNAEAGYFLEEYERLYEISDFKNALLSYKKYLSYKDSINTIRNARNVTDLNALYKTAEKQRDIEIMDRENSLKLLDLEKKKQIRLILYTLTIFLLIFLTISANFVRLKIRKKRMLGKEINTRRRAENDLWQTKKELEELVEQRKFELLGANKKLQNKMAEIEELQQKIFKAERLKIVGEMAAGMVEVIENPVRSIAQEIKSFRNEYSDSNKEIDDMGNILEEASHKVNDTLQNLNQYSLADKTDLKPIDLNKTIRNSVNLFKFRKLDKQVKLITELSKRIPKLLLDKVKMEGVLINLILNSIDAIDKGGEIRIKTKISGSNVIMTLSDNGCGIEKERFDDVISPFYTTKKKGFGLGLSIVNKNIESMHGTISFHSELEKGTTVEIGFPMGAKSE